MRWRGGSGRGEILKWKLIDGGRRGTDLRRPHDEVVVHRWIVSLPETDGPTTVWLMEHPIVLLLLLMLRVVVVIQVAGNAHDTGILRGRRRRQRRKKQLTVTGHRQITAVLLLLMLLLLLLLLLLDWAESTRRREDHEIVTSVSRIAHFDSRVIGRDGRFGTD